MKKTGYVCYPCWKKNGSEKPYSRSYDLFAHMVNVHEKYPDGAVNKAAYSTDGSNVRDATEEEKVRYRDANKHSRKKVDEKSSSSEPSASTSGLVGVATAPARPASARAKRSTDNASSGDRGGGNRGKDKERDKSRDSSRNKGESEKSDDCAGARAQETCDPTRNKTATALVGAPDEEEADRREMAEIQGRIQARRVAKNLEVGRATIKELKSSTSGAPVVPSKTSRRATQRSKGEGEKEPGIARETNKSLAKPVSRGLTDSRGDDPLSTLKFIAIEKTVASHNSSTDDMSGVE